MHMVINKTNQVLDFDEIIVDLHLRTYADLAIFIYAMSFVKIQDLIGFVYDHMHLRTYADLYSFIMQCLSSKSKI